MSYRNVAEVADTGLCCSCGLCETVCPMGSVSLVERGGSWIPEVRDCCGCGRCLRVCPGAVERWDETRSTEEQMKGSCLKAATAWSNNESVFSNAVSGGVATQLVYSLLEAGAYDAAFLAGEAMPGKRLDALLCRAGDELSKTQKSKYVQVSHAGTLRYMRDHPDERLIVVGVACAVRGLLNAIELYGLGRDNYLFVGLFCDKTMRYGVLDRLASLGSGEVSFIDFRNKEPSGWPGDVVLHWKDGSKEVLPRERRMEVKELFCPERCLYCLDKLNVKSDISLGDNYTGDGANTNGANSVIVRTERGMNAWKRCATLISEVPSSLEMIAESQKLESRVENLAFSEIKRQRSGCSAINKGLEHEGVTLNRGVVRKYDRLVAEGRLGLHYEKDPKAIEREVALRRPSLLKRMFGRVKSLLRRSKA